MPARPAGLTVDEIWPLLTIGTGTLQPHFRTYPNDPI
jgi:hypothetical protein